MYIFTQFDKALLNMRNDITVVDIQGGWFAVKHGEDVVAEYDDECRARALVALIAEAYEDGVALFRTDKYFKGEQS